MPLSNISKRTEKILTVKRRQTGLSNPQLIELAILNFHHFKKGRGGSLE